MTAAAVVTQRGGRRWRDGHPWIYRSDVRRSPREPGIVAVEDERGRFLGQALCSPASEIRLRLLEATDRPIDLAWWRDRLVAARDRRAGIDANAWRAVHAEADGLPALVVDRYDRWLVVQLLSAGLEQHRKTILAALAEVHAPEGILCRHDVPARRLEGLSQEIELVAGSVPQADRGPRGRGSVAGRTMDRAEDRSIPRPTRPSPTRRVAGARGWDRTRLLQLPRLLRAASRRQGVNRRGTRPERGGAGAGSGTRRDERTRQHHLHGGGRLRPIAGLGIGGPAIRRGGRRPTRLRQGKVAPAGRAAGLPRAEPPGDGTGRPWRLAADRQLLLPPPTARLPGDDRRGRRPERSPLHARVGPRPAARPSGGRSPSRKPAI